MEAKPDFKRVKAMIKLRLLLFIFGVLYTFTVVRSLIYFYLQVAYIIIILYGFLAVRL